MNGGNRRKMLAGIPSLIPTRVEIMKRDRNRVQRERCVDLRGSIPKQAGGWAPYSDTEYCVSGFLLTDRVPRPYLGNQTQDDWDDWTILRLDYGLEGVAISVVLGFSEDTQSRFSSPNFRATEVRYACIDMPQSIREMIMAEHFGGSDILDIDNRIPSFFVHLAKIARFNRVVTKGTRLTYEFRYLDQKPGFVL